jgi:CRISPR-associated protein Cas1
LFTRQLSEVVKQAFAKVGTEAGKEIGPPSESSESSVSDRADLSPKETPEELSPQTSPSGFKPPSESKEPSEPIPARMLNEFVYCPRLYYYEYVEGVFVESADTVKGAVVHARVDKGKGALPQSGESSSATESEETKSSADAEEIHSRSVMLGSDRLGVTAKMDLVEATLNEAGNVMDVCPVDYKVGAPREGKEGLELWDADRMQLGLQCLILRDNGYACEAGIIYYRQTKQRVRLELTPELEEWVCSQIAAARSAAMGPMPPPLVDSPKCVRCSLAPLCLPDETRMLSIPTEEKFATEQEDEAPDRPTLPDRPASSAPPRRLMAPRDEKRALYLNTQGYRVGCNDAVIKVKEKDHVVDEVRVSDVCHVAIFGNIQVSTQAVQRFCDHDIPVTWFSMGGWFYGMTRGHSLKNVLLRIEQFRTAADQTSCLRLARQFVRGKIHNHRVFFMRNHIDPPESVKLRLGRAREDALAALSLEELLGVEGAAAAVYFQQFGGLIRDQEEEDLLEGIAPVSPKPGASEFSFDFTRRNRRPPSDPVNALLSLAYSLLAKECTLAAYAVGLDPYVGFYHQPRHGRPALALDVMEEFRPLVAESAVLTAINNRFISVKDFVSAGHAVNLNPGGRKQFFQCFEQRMNSLITHPVFDYKVSYRRAIELQFRILARVLTGEIPEYIPFMTR